MATVLYLVIPCYNEEEVILLSAGILKDKMNSLIGAGRISPESRVMFVDDGSADSTWEKIAGLQREDALFSGVKLRKNSGQQNAILAGYFEAAKHCDAVISLDVDLQDDIHAIDKMVKEYENGNEIVYGVRDSRETDGFMKKHTSLLFYKVMHLLGTKLIENSAQFRLLSKNAVQILSAYGERCSYLPALLPTLGLKSAKVYFKRNERLAGSGKFPYSKLFQLAFDAIVSSSKRPIALITVFAALSFLLCIANLILYAVPAVRESRLIICAALWGGFTLLLGSIRIIGEYISNILIEVKQRPRYIVEQVVLEEK